MPKTKTKTVDKDKDKDKTIPKTKTNIKTKDKDKAKTKINNKMNLIDRTYIKLKKAKTEITNKIKTVDKEMRELKRDLWSRAVILNEIDAILDDAINVVRYLWKKRKNSKMAIDKHKTIDKYVSGLGIIIKDKSW